MKTNNRRPDAIATYITLRGFSLDDAKALMELLQEDMQNIHDVAFPMRPTGWTDRQFIGQSAAGFNFRIGLYGIESPVIHCITMDIYLMRRFEYIVDLFCPLNTIEDLPF